MQERLAQVRGGARNAGLAVAMTLLVAVLGLGAFGVRGVFAQASTPTTEGAGTAGSTTDEFADGSEADAAYADFVAGLAANLGTDAATVEAAIAQTLADMVDAKLAAGEISANEAAALTQRIAAGDTPFRLGWLGGDHGRGGPGGPDGAFGGRGPRGDRSGDDDRDDSLDGVGGGTTDDAEAEGTPVSLT